MRTRLSIWTLHGVSRFADTGERSVRTNIDREVYTIDSKNSEADCKGIVLPYVL